MGVLRHHYYGMIFFNTLEYIGFKFNSYDICVANKQIDGE